MTVLRYIAAATIVAGSWWMVYRLVREPVRSGQGVFLMTLIAGGVTVYAAKLVSV